MDVCETHCNAYIVLCAIVNYNIRDISRELRIYLRLKMRKQQQHKLECRHTCIY